MAVDLKSMRVPLSLSLFSLFASSTAFGGGFYITDIGSRGMGRAGAFVASPDDLLAIHYNPAGLSLLKGLHFQGDMQIVDYRGHFDRHCPCVGETVENREELDQQLAQTFAPARSSTPLFIPFIGLAYGLDLLDITIAVALWGPASGRTNYGELPPADRPTFPQRALEQPNRYSALEAKNLEANFALGLSISPFEGLRVGFTGMVFQNGADQTLHLWANPLNLAAGPEDPNLDIPIRFQFKETFSFSWQFGLAYDLPFLEGLTIGASFRGKRDIRTPGNITVQLPAKLADVAEVQGDQVTVELGTAPIARAGIQYKIEKLFRAEAAFVWEGWANHDDIVIRPQDINFVISGSTEPMKLDKIVTSRRWQNTWSLRLGGEINLLEPYLGIRAGYFYEPSAIPIDRLDPSRVDLNKHGIGLGVTTTWYGFTLDVSGMYVALQSQDVSTSQARLMAPINSDPDLETFIGNGRYSGRYLIFGASLHFALDPLLEDI